MKASDAVAERASVSMHALAAGTFVPMLNSLSALLDKAAANKTIDLAALPAMRLAPDMFPLAQQVQIACDHAKNATARLTGEKAPRHEDTEKTIDELKARIAKAIAYVESVKPAAFAGAEARAISFPLFEGRSFDANGFDYLRDWALPHFYFHVVTAYDILRHAGVTIGKQDYLAHARPHIRRGA
jgi:uncharacterized protein